MKTKNLILGIALVALTATSFGQRSSIKERLFNKQNNQVEYSTADYSMNETSRIESWMHDVRSWASNRISRDTYKTPAVSQTIFVERIEVIYEDELHLESWMATPFESSIAEEEINLESWMATPFESSIAEEEITIESWMTTPFEAAQDIEVEAWMTSAWI